MSKSNKVILIMITTIVFIAATIVVSFIIESKSQKLPAVVKTATISLRTQVAGSFLSYHVAPNSKVKKGQLIASLQNEQLQLKLSSLESEKENLLTILESYEDGAHLDLELNKIEKDIIEENNSLLELQEDLTTVNIEIIEYEKNLTVLERHFNSYKTLIEQNLISNEEFAKVSEDYFKVVTDYKSNKAKAISLENRIESATSLIANLNEKKQLVRKNNTLLNSKYQGDLDKINSELAELKAEIAELEIYSPIDGYLTDVSLMGGELVEKGDEIAEVSDLKRVWIMAYGNSVTSKKMPVGNQVVIYAAKNKELTGKVFSVSPIMDKVKSLSSSFETVNTYTKIEIKLDDLDEALKYITPGERLFVRVSY